MNLQKFYDNACTSLRTYGNPYGSRYSREWAWVNHDNPNERCAIARFIKGNTSIEVVENLKKELKLSKHIDPIAAVPLVGEIVQLFDSYAFEINNKVSLEYHLKEWADHYNLKYSEASAVDFKPVCEEIY